MRSGIDAARGVRFLFWRLHFQVRGILAPCGGGCAGRFSRWEPYPPHRFWRSPHLPRRPSTSTTIGGPPTASETQPVLALLPAEDSLTFAAARWPRRAGVSTSA